VLDALDELVCRASSSSQLDECVLSAYVLDIESIYAVRLTSTSFDKLLVKCSARLMSSSGHLV